MPGTAVVVKGGTLVCSHPPGTVIVSTVAQRLMVNGSGVLLSGQEPELHFAGCLNPTHPPSPVTPTPAPCISEAATAGKATKLTVGGTPVLLATGKGKTTPDSTVPNADTATPGTWSVSSPGPTGLTAV
jgi:hypothetical protein